MATQEDQTRQEPGIRVRIEVDEGFETGKRTSAALAELVEALHDEHGDDEVAGFSFDRPIRTGFELTEFTFASPGSSAFYDGWPQHVTGGPRSFDGKGNDQ